MAREDWESGRNSMFTVSATEFESWTNTAAFPLIPDPMAGEVFRQMRTHPPFRDTAGFEFRPVQGDINSATNRDLFDTDSSRRRGTVPVLTGSSFNLWNPDFGDPYGWADSEAEAHILAKTLSSANRARSAFNGLDIAVADDLPMHRARIAFRDVTNPTNQRTAIVCLVPPGVILVHKAPYLVR